MNLKSKRYALLGVLLLVSSVGIVSQFYPVIDDLFVRNPFWNGLSDVYNLLDPIRVQNLDVLYRSDPSSSTLLFIGPSTGFSVDEVESVKVFAERGGHVIVADDFGSGNDLLEGLGLDVRFTGDLLLDSVFYDMEHTYPRLLNFSAHNMMPRDIVLNYATTLSDDFLVHSIETSSPFSFVSREKLVEFRSYPVLGCVEYGDGEITLFSDSSVWINSMIGKEGNRDLLLGMAKGNVYIDEVHLAPSILTELNRVFVGLYFILRIPEVRYSLVVFGSLMLWYYRSKPSGEAPLDEVEELLKRHSEWDREQVSWLQMQRRKTSGDQ